MKNVEDIYPLSPMQQGMLFHALYAPEAGIYLEQIYCILEGDLNVSAFQRAWQRLVDRQQILRTAFLWKGLDDPVQVVRQSVKLPWKQEDWQTLSSDKQQEQLEAYLQADRLRGMDLSRAPLMRLALFRLSANVYQFVWTQHHISVDGWSLPIIFREVLVSYEALCQGQDIHLEKNRPYRDYIAWLQHQDLPRAEAFWREELKGFAAPTPLRIDRKTGHLSDHTAVYDEQRLGFSEAETLALQSLAQRHQLTVNTLVQAAWGLLLSHYSERDDVIFGATVSGRPTDLPGVEAMVGPFINTLPVRIRIVRDASLIPWLKQIQAQQVEARQYDYSPLAEVQKWSEIPRHLPLFDSTLVFENYPVNIDSQAQYSSLKIYDLHSQFRGNYILMIKAEIVGVFWINTLYDSNIFDNTTMHRLLVHLKILLNSMVTHADFQVSALVERLAEAEREENLIRKRRRKEINLTNFMQVNLQDRRLSQEKLVKKSYFNETTYPLIIQPAIDDLDLIHWAQGNLEVIEEELSKYGSLLFRDFGVNSVAAFEQFVQTIRPDLYGDYGDLPREEVSGNVYHSTPYPENKTILFHNESSHLHRWPMKQWFHCIKAAQEGGETPIVDCRKIYQRLDPQIRECFKQKQLMYVRNFVEGLDVSWQSFFHTNDKTVVEAYCRKASLDFEWTAHNGLRTYQICPGVARHPKTGEMVFFNQIQLHHMSCLEPDVRDSMLSLFSEQDLPRQVYYGDGSPIEDAVMQEISNVYWETAVSFTWQEGDILMLDNMLTAHARNPFKGERKIVVALAEMISVNDVISFV